MAKRRLEQQPAEALLAASVKIQSDLLRLRGSRKMLLPMFCCFGPREGDEDADSDDEDAEGVGNNPIVRTYLIPNEHGTCKKYWAELVLVVGLVLPWMGPIGSLCVASPFIKLGVQQSQVTCGTSQNAHSLCLPVSPAANMMVFGGYQVITPDTDCFGSAYAVCNAESYFDYYFWNVTNAQEVGNVGCKCTASNQSDSGLKLEASVP